MKKVLILTASVGEGHNQAAYSLKNTFSSNGYYAVTFDFIKETSRLLNSVIIGGYKCMIFNYPKLYGNVYRLSNEVSINLKINRYLKKIFEARIISLINEIKPDIIMGTHAFAVTIISNLKRDKKINIPFISVITDFEAHYAYLDDNVNAYIVACEHTKQNMIGKGIMPSRIFPYGIPIRQEFLYNYNKVSINFDNKLTILVMGGGMGVSCIAKVLKSIILNKNSLRIIVICGRNEKLKTYLKSKYTDKFANKEVEIIGYTNEVSKFMGEADIIITKPGGLTVSEAIAKELPIVIPFSIPGQEDENARFLVRVGAAMEVKKICKLNLLINNLISHPQMLEIMRNNIRRLFPIHSSKSILELTSSLIKQDNQILSLGVHSNHMIFNQITGSITLIK